MKQILLTATLVVLGIAPLVSRAALLVYEPFDYPVGPLIGQNAGLGFSGGWSAPNANEGGAVYDQNTTNVSSGSETGVAALTWDGKVNNLPTSPTVGARYQGGRTNQSNVNIYRSLASSAGNMAAGNGGVLWMSAVYHLTNRALGAGITLGLANGYMTDRGRVFNPSTTSFIGVNGATNNSGTTAWNYRLNAFATAGGWTAGQFSRVPGTNSLPVATNDLVVVMKFTFGASDIVEACVFTENETLSEAAFYTSTNYVSATNAIDETQLSTLTLAQGRMANAQDDVRIGTSFMDVVTLPPVGPVDLITSTVTASSTNLFADGVATTTITVTLKDAIGLGVPGKSVTLSSSPGFATISPAGAQTTDSNGQATFTVKSTTAATEVFTATDTTDNVVISQSPSVEFTAVIGDANTSTVSASPTNVFANGISSSTITVTVRNAGGLPVSGKSVTLSSSPGTAVITPAGPQITTNGVATFTATSTQVGAVEFTATDTTDSVVITQTAWVEFSPTVAASNTSTMVASPAGVYADGVSSSTITVTMRNSSGLPLAGKSVLLTSSPGFAVITPAGAQVTGPNGVVTFTTTSTHVGTELFIATNTTDSVLLAKAVAVNFVDSNAPIAINLNFYASSGTITNPQNAALLSGPIGGLGESWNQFNTLSGSNLVSSKGVITGVGFTNNVPTGWEVQGVALEMLKASRAQFTKGADTTNVITGLRAGSYYNLWVASYNENLGVVERTFGEWSTPNPTATVGPQMIDCRSGLNNQSWEQGRNYVRFENVKANANGQIVLIGDAADAGDYGDPSAYRLHLNGLQLVETIPPSLTIAPSPGNPGKFNLSWNSKAGKLYDLVSTNDLQVSLNLWPVWDSLTNIAATPPRNTLTNIAVGDPRRFFAMIERDAPPPPPLLSKDFENDNGGFLAVGTPNDWAWGTPLSDSSFGFVLNFGNGGSAKCWGTALGDGSSPSGLINTAANSILQSPVIDFTGVTVAKLSFAAAVDAAVGDTIEILVREAGTDALLATLAPIAVPKSATWASFAMLDISAAAGKTAYLQFRFAGTDATYCGLYIDDVVVTGN